MTKLNKMSGYELVRRLSVAVANGDTSSKYYRELSRLIRELRDNPFRPGRDVVVNLTPAMRREMGLEELK